jgi:hypothetical protein
MQRIREDQGLKGSVILKMADAIIHGEPCAPAIFGASMTG